MDGWIGMHASAVGVAFLGEFGSGGKYHDGTNLLTVCVVYCI